jgi:formate C-acetyltransferase
MGLATVVDSLIAIRHLVFEQQRLSLPEFRDVLEDNWEGREALRAEIRQHLPRYGQDCPETRLLVAEVGWMWVEEVEAASRGLTRAHMWPGFYSHMAHVHEGRRTGATPDGRAAGGPLSESLSPSPGTPPCAPTAVLNTMSVLPFTHTPSGAASLALPASATGSPPDPERIRALIDAYFAQGGLHLHINALSAATLLDALRAPDRHADLMVRVAGFSALFVRLSPEVQQDIVSRFQDGD